MSFDIKEKPLKKNKNELTTSPIVGKVKFSIAAKESIILSDRDYDQFYNLLVDNKYTFIISSLSLSLPLSPSLYSLLLSSPLFSSLSFSYPLTFSAWK